MATGKPASKGSKNGSGGRTGNGAGGSLYSAVIYQRLLEEGVEVPGYQMSAVLNAFKVGELITASLRTQREEDVREHGDFLITSVHSDLCNSSS